MKKYYTVKEVAKKFRVSEGHVYELVRNGELKKEEGLGRAVRIPVNEIKNLKNKSHNLSYNKDKVQVIKTHLGDVRKVKEKDEYILSDITKALMLTEGWTIARALDKNKYKKLSNEEAKELGLSPRRGFLTIKYSGIAEYLEEKSLNLNNLDFERFLKELKVNDHEQVKSKEVEYKSIKLTNMFEGHKVDIITVNNQPLFELYSTGMALGYSRTDGKSISDHGGQKAFPRKDRIDKVISNADIEPVVHGVQQYLTEEMLYDFMLEAKTEKCKSFRKWVTNEVLPTIRKTGGYVDNTNKFTDFYFSNLSLEVREAIKKELINRNEVLENKKRELITKVKELDSEYNINNKVIESLA